MPAPAAPARRLRRHTRRLPWAVDTEAAAAVLLDRAAGRAGGDADGPGRPREAFWLDSSRSGDAMARWSYLGTASDVVPPVVTRDGPVLDRLAGALAATEVVGDRSAAPFGGGYIGYLGYEARAECGFPVRRRAATPDAAWVFVDRLVAVDHREGTTHLVALVPEPEPVPRAWFDTTAAALADLRPLPDPDPLPVVTRDQVAAVMAAGRDRYVDDVDRCLRHLRDGDSYEICLTTRGTAPVRESGLDVHRRLRRASPAPYAAYLRVAGVEIASASPERFLRVDADGTVETRPIKGTAPRGTTRAEDAALAAALARDTKTRAENLMIVDLLRNDLHRVCEPGTVAVPRLMAVESYTTVHQLVTTVRGRLREGLGAVDAVRACFPGGSMTGAPKHRTVEIIDGIEGSARGVYSGVLGWLGLDGAADLSVVIRTAVRHGTTWTVGAGGAVVLDSEPEAEYDEMLLKAAVPLGVLLPPLTGGRQPSRAGRVSRREPPARTVR